MNSAVRKQQKFFAFFYLNSFLWTNIQGTPMLIKHLKSNSLSAMYTRHRSYTFSHPLNCLCKHFWYRFICSGSLWGGLLVFMRNISNNFRLSLILSIHIKSVKSNSGEWLNSITNINIYYLYILSYNIFYEKSCVNPWNNVTK